jgi:signal transduction histidine kinase/ActR/RegA family two-component response regulator
MRPRVGPRVDRLLDYREYPILFVDDEAENLRVFELAFRREFEIRTARSGEEAMQALHERPAALVLSDHRMDGMSGVELLAKVREVDAKTVRILVTAYGDASTLSDAINNGWIYRYVAKPWRPEEMRLTLRNGIEMYALAREREELLFELDALNRTAKLLSGELALMPLLDLILDTVTTEFGFDGATVFLFDDGGERLQALRSAPREGGVADRLATLDVPATTAPEFLAALREGRTQIVRMSELTNLEGPLRRLATEIAAEEILVLPLLGHPGVIGALAVDNRKGGESFGAADYTLLDGLASQAVIAIGNARLVEDLRRSREEVRRADRLGTLGTLAAGLAHEINNPLVAIRTFLTLAPAKRHEDDREFWNEYHDLSLREVDRIHALVRTMGRLGRGDDETPRSACDLREIAEEAVRLLAPEATRGAVTVEVETAPDLPKVVAVRDHVHQVLLNLLLNAIHATARPSRAGGGAEGRVRVVLRPETSAGRPGACIEVLDQGCGIPADDLERIFDPFYTTKGPDQGSGLGLMICHRIVQDHGGRIEVESLEGRGSTFRIWLPVEES